jgi:hypothetical protein
MEANRTDERALAAASAVAAEHGLTFEQATVVQSASNVLIHLRPAPVVARVMTGTAVLHDDLELWLSREVAVLTFLSPSGLAVRPSPAIAPGPYHRDGLWLTFWEWVGEHAHADLSCSAATLGRSLRDLHDALSEFDGELGDLLDLRDDIDRLLRQLRPTEALGAETIDSLRDRLVALDGSVFAARRTAQAIHGDVSLSNLLRVDGRLVWNDFEDTLHGPVEWDVASLVVSLRSRGADAAFVDEALEAYGWAGKEDLAPFVEAHDIYGEVWQAYVVQRQLGAH